MDVYERSIVGETIGILRAIAGKEAFHDIGSDIKAILNEQANRLEKVLDYDVHLDASKASEKERFLINY